MTSARSGDGPAPRTPEEREAAVRRLVDEAGLSRPEAEFAVAQALGEVPDRDVLH